MCDLISFALKNLYMKFTKLTILIVLSSVKYIHMVVQPISRTFIFDIYYMS